MFDALASALAWFYDLVPNYAAAIALLTGSIMILLTPLTLKGTRSMMAMQQYQPEIRRIQQEHKGDRQKLNEEMLAFYQEHKINPLGGCLPLLIQAPVFLVLYRVIDGITKLPPKYLSETSRLYTDLVADAGRMPALGLDLDVSPNDALRADLVDGLPYLILVGITAVTSFVQNRQMQARQRKNPNAPQMPAQQQVIFKILPFMLPFFSFFVPAALVIYFIVSNLYRVAQQAYIQRTMYDADGPTAAKAVKPPKPNRGDDGDGDVDAGSTGSDGSRAKDGVARRDRQTPSSSAHPKSRKNQKRNKRK